MSHVEPDIHTNNNSGHIVVENSENNNVDPGAANLHHEEDDNDDTADEGTAAELWLSEGEDEDEDVDEDYEQGQGDGAVAGVAVGPTGTVAGGGSIRRVPVPASELPETVTVLEKDDCRVYLVGTAHFSKESQEDVAKVIRATQPHRIMVELCQSRTNILKMDEARILEEAKNINMATIQSVIQQNGVMQGVLNILLLNMSAYITKELGMAPGGEFRVAFNEASKLKDGCKFILGDRSIQITLRRALCSLSVWQRIKLTYAILFSKEPITKEDVEKCKQKDMLEQMIEEMAGEFPALGEVFVRERDVYLAWSLRELTRPVPCPDAPGGSVPAVVVGVVGIGHVQGIVENWEKELDVHTICRIPPASTMSTVTKWGVRLSVLGLLSYGCYRASKLTIIPMIAALSVKR